MSDFEGEDVLSEEEELANINAHAQFVHQIPQQLANIAATVYHHKHITKGRHPATFWAFLQRVLIL